MVEFILYVTTYIFIQGENQKDISDIQSKTVQRSTPNTKRNASNPSCFGGFLVYKKIQVGFYVATLLLLHSNLYYSMAFEKLDF